MAEELEPDRILDICGEFCPITFARTKVALEEMAVGQVLKVVLDYPPASQNVPRSVSLYGDKVLRVEQPTDQLWEIYIQKLVP